MELTITKTANWYFNFLTSTGKKAGDSKPRAARKEDRVLFYHGNGEAMFGSWRPQDVRLEVGEETFDFEDALELMDKLAEVGFFFLNNESSVSQVYKAELSQSGGGGVDINEFVNTLGVEVSYATQSIGQYGVTMVDDTVNYYSARISNVAGDRTVKIDGVINYIGTFRQFDLSGNPIANFSSVYIEIRPLNS